MLNNFISVGIGGTRNYHSAPKHQLGVYGNKAWKVKVKDRKNDQQGKQYDKKIAKHNNFWLDLQDAGLD